MGEGKGKVVFTMGEFGNAAMWARALQCSKGTCARIGIEEVTPEANKKKAVGSLVGAPRRRQGGSTDDFKGLVGGYDMAELGGGGLWGCQRIGREA